MIPVGPGGSTRQLHQIYYISTRDGRLFFITKANEITIEYVGGKRKQPPASSGRFQKVEFLMICLFLASIISLYNFFIQKLPL